MEYFLYLWFIMPKAEVVFYMFFLKLQQKMIKLKEFWTVTIYLYETQEFTDANLKGTELLDILELSFCWGWSIYCLYKVEYRSILTKKALVHCQCFGIRWISCITVVIFLFYIDDNYSDDYKWSEKLRYKETAGLVLHNGFL